MSLWISPEYQALQAELHARPQGYGGKGRKWAPVVRELIAWYDARTVLDYGCGEGSLGSALPGIAEYDPAMPGKDAPPAPADLVVCTDVLEHIEPEKLPAVLIHLRFLTRTAALLVVALDATHKILADGRNAHLIQESPAWWETQVTAAGFRCEPLTIPIHLSPEKRAKRWIAVAR